jgi:hypothetical protein
MGWCYGLTLHIVINHQGELLACPGAPQHGRRRPVPKLLECLWGRSFGDAGYLDRKLFVVVLVR